METAIPLAEQRSALHKILAGRYKRMGVALVDVDPRCKPMTQALVVAVKSGDADRIEFESKRAEALRRAVGQLLVQVDETKSELAALAGDESFDEVQAEIAVHVQRCGAVQRRLGAWVDVISTVQTKARHALRRLEQTQSRIESEWLRLQARAEKLAEAGKAHELRLAWLREVVRRSSGFAKATREARKQFDKVTRERALLQRQFEEVGDAVDALYDRYQLRQLPAAFAEHFDAEHQKVLDRLLPVAKTLEKLPVIQIDLEQAERRFDTRSIAKVLGVPESAVSEIRDDLRASPSKQLDALLELGRIYELEDKPKELLAELRERDLVP